jgi:hypothetical protein
VDDKDSDVFCELLLKSSMILQIKIGALLALSLGTMVITMLCTGNRCGRQEQGCLDPQIPSQFREEFGLTSDCKLTRLVGAD